MKQMMYTHKLNSSMTTSLKRVCNSKFKGNTVVSKTQPNGDQSVAEFEDILSYQENEWNTC